jgi:hypothetical protein
LVAIVFIAIFTYMVDRGGGEKGRRKVAEALAKANERNARAFEAVRGRWVRIARREHDRMSDSDS